MMHNSSTHRYSPIHASMPDLLYKMPVMQEVVLGPCIIPDEPVGKKLKERVLCIKDPDGYSFEITETAYRRDPVTKVTLMVLDMEKSIDFYQDVSSWMIECMPLIKDKMNAIYLFPYDYHLQTADTFVCVAIGRI